MSTGIEDFGVASRRHTMMIKKTTEKWPCYNPLNNQDKT
jgi:hypothetical protein